MVAFYVDKIKNQIINPNTDAVWKIEDVPKLWKSKVEKELKEVN